MRPSAWILGALVVLASGIGPRVADAVASGQAVIVSDAGIRFGPRPVWSQSRVRVVEVFNAGSLTMPIGVRVDGEGFRIAGAATTCLRIGALPPGEQCAVGVRFAPAVVGAARGRVVISTRSGPPLARVRLRGRALVAESPQLFVVAVHPSRIRFGSQAVSTRSAPRVVTVSDPVARPVAIRRVRLAGAFPGSFRLGRQTCTGTLRPGRTCTIRVRFAPAFLAVRTATLQIVVASPHLAFAVALSGRGSSSVPSVRNAPLTLAAIDRGCFYSPSSPGSWPLAPRTRPHAIRGGFNDPRGAALTDFGVDASAHNEAPALAVRSGTIDGISAVGNPADEHFVLESSDGVSRYFYYHVRPAIGDGTAVAGGQVLGNIERGYRHVHLSEIVSGCGLVDPRRPTGILRDPGDTEAPAIGSLAAYRADASAYRPFPLDRSPSRDSAKRLPLDDLHGLVDLRAVVSDTPRHATVQWRQQPLMVAGVRSFLAPFGRPGRHYGRVIVALDGSRLIDPSQVFQVFAHGTYRLNACFYRQRPCVTVLRLHVAAGGFDTRQFANGNYLYCVSAITIRSRTARNCTPVTIRN